MQRTIFSIISGIVLFFLILLLGYSVFITTGATPIGKDIQLIAKHKDFDKIEEELTTEGFLQLQDQVFQFTFLVFFPGVCLLTGLIAGFIARTKFWLIGLLSLTPGSILMLITGATSLIHYRVYSIMYSIPLALLYLGLGSLGGFIAGYFKKKKMTV
jgi:hypothetical protein